MTQISRIPRIAYDFAASALVGYFAYDNVQDYEPALSAAFGFISGGFFCDGISNLIKYYHGDSHFTPIAQRYKKRKFNANILDEHLFSDDDENPALG